MLRSVLVLCVGGNEALASLEDTAVRLYKRRTSIPSDIDIDIAWLPDFSTLQQLLQWHQEVVTDSTAHSGFSGSHCRECVEPEHGFVECCRCRS